MCASLVRTPQLSLSVSALSFNAPAPAARTTSRATSATMMDLDGLKAQGKLLEVNEADFGLLFAHIDAFVVHGGLGTTVEALRTGKPVAVSGCLLFDQRFWGRVCAEYGVGPKTAHIRDLHRSCVPFIDQALDEGSSYVTTAKTLTWGDPADDGVKSNVDCMRALLEAGVPPIDTKNGVKMISRSTGERSPSSGPTNPMI